MERCLVTLFALAVAITSTSTLGASGENTIEQSSRDWLTMDVPLSDARRLRPFGNNYAIWQSSKTDTGVEDDAALEVAYSFEYILRNCGTSRFTDRCASKAGLEVAFSYTGGFDFYVTTRNSDPVINRISNPALHFRWRPDEKVTTYSLSIEHRSTGQVVEIGAMSNPSVATADAAYAQGNIAFFDAISHGADYVKLKTDFLAGKDPDDCDNQFLCARFSIGAKLYFSDDGDVDWGVLAPVNTNFADYDLVRLNALSRFMLAGRRSTLHLEYIVGDRLSETDSYNVNVIMDFGKGNWNVPVLLRYHNGPMDRLSNYTQSFESVGLGMMFSI